MKPVTILFRLLFLNGLILLHTFRLEAQTLNFKQLTTRDGLPCMEVYSIIQDHDGYIWISTMLGIVKHNGQSLTPVCTNIPVREHTAFVFFLGPDKHLYFANSFAKVYKVEKDSARLLSEIDIFSKRHSMQDVFSQLIIEKNGDIDFSTYTNTYHYDRKTKKLKTISTNDTNKVSELSYKKIEGSLLPVRNNINRAIYPFPYSIISLPGKGEIKTSPMIFSTRTHMYEIGQYAYYFNGKTLYKTLGSELVATRQLTGFINAAVSPDRHLWVMTGKGILVLDQNLDSVASYLPDRLTNHVCFDRSGGIWVSTIGHGVYYCRDVNEKKYLMGDNPSIQLVGCSASTPHFVTEQGEFYIMSGKKAEKIYQFPGGTYVTDVLENKDNYMVTTKQGIFLISKEKRTLEEILDEWGNSIYSKTPLTVAKDTFLCINAMRLLLIHNKKVIRRTVGLFPQAVLHENKKHLLISNRDGLWRYNWRKNEYIPIDTVHKEMLTAVMKYDENRNLWIGTQCEGLFVRSPDGKLTHMDNCPFTAVYNIIFYERTMVVLANNGVFAATFHPTAYPKSWINISPGQPVAIASFDRTLWIGSSEGLFSIDLTRLEDVDEYPIVISSIFTKGKSIDPLRMSLEHNENDLRFNFDFLNYKWPAKGFHFTLDGPSQIKGNVPGNVLQMQNLAPGEYMLKVYPIHGDHYNPDHFLSKAFTIYPAYWQTVWFKVMLIILLVLATALTVAFYHNRKRRRQTQTAEINRLLVEYKLTALKAQINPHFISNSLAAIQLLIDAGNVVKANQYIAKFSLLIRYVLDYSDKSASRLNDELDIIRLNVELEQLRFDNEFDFKIEIDPGTDIYDLHIPPLITQPFIENAIWHGLLPLKNVRMASLLLKVSETNDFVVIEIIDNGVGRKKTIQGTPITNSKRESKGTQLIRKRIENLNQLYNTEEAEIVIEDLFDRHGDPSGTRIKIIFPLQMLDKLSEKDYESHTGR